MKINKRLILGFGVIILLMAVVGSFGHFANKHLINSIESGEKHLRAIVSSATDVSSYAKMAESNLLLYLSVHDQTYKSNFFTDLASLKKSIAILDSKIEHVDARNILKIIQKENGKVEQYGLELIARHDQKIAENGSYSPDEFHVQIRRFHDTTSATRRHGIKLADFETDFLNRQEAITAATDIVSYAKRAEGHLMMYLLLDEEIDRKKFYQRHQFLQDSIQNLESRTLAPEALQLLSAIKTQAKTILPVGEALLAAYDTAKKNNHPFKLAEHDKLALQMYTHVTDVVDKGRRLAQFNVDLEVQDKEMVIERAKILQRYIIGVIIIAVVAAIAIGHSLGSSIAFPLQKLKNAVNEIGQGRFDVVIDIPPKGELGELADSFRQMAYDLKKSTISKEYLDYVFMSMAESLIVTTTDGTIQTVNNTLCSMLGYRSEDLEGLHISELFAEPSAVKMSDATSYLEGGDGVTNVENAFLARDGSKIPIIFSASKMRNSQGDILGIVWVALDITERKQAEMALRKLEVERAIAKNASLASIGELTSSIVHEMRSPLAAIQMNLEMLHEKVKKDEIYKELTDISLRQVDRLEEMFTDLINYGKPLQLQFERTSVGQLIAEALKLIENKAKKKAVTIKVENTIENLLVSVDKELIIRALTNIIDNSLHWAPEGGTILISGHVTTESEKISISISDNGPGIQEESLGRIFTPFFTTRKGGTGLGLAIVKKIIDYHDGTVIAGNNDLTGAVFTINLPYKGLTNDQDSDRG